MESKEQNWNCRQHCILHNSYPLYVTLSLPSHLQAPDRYLIRYKNRFNNEYLEQSTLGLHFQAKHDHFPNNFMSLRCTAIITFYKTTEPTRQPPLSLLSREHFYGGWGSGSDALILLWKVYRVEQIIHGAYPVVTYIVSQLAELLQLQ